MIVVEYPCEIDYYYPPPPPYDMELYFQPSFGERQDGDGDNYFSLRQPSLFNNVDDVNNNIPPPRQQSTEDFRGGGGGGSSSSSSSSSSVSSST